MEQFTDINLEDIDIDVDDIIDVIENVIDVDDDDPRITDQELIVKRKMHSKILRGAVAIGGMAVLGAMTITGLIVPATIATAAVGGIMGVIIKHSRTKDKPEPPDEDEEEE